MSKSKIKNAGNVQDVQDVKILKTLKDFCDNSGIKNYLSYSKSLLIVDNKIDVKTSNITDYVMNFYNNCKDKNSFYLNFNAIIHYFYNEKHENISYISLSSVNKSLQYINNKFNLIFVIEYFERDNEIFFRIKKAGEKRIVTLKKVTSQELFEKKFNSIEKSYKSLKEEFDVYTSNNKSLKAVKKFRDNKKKNEKKNSKK